MVKRGVKISKECLSIFSSLFFAKRIISHEKRDILPAILACHQQCVVYLDTLILLLGLGKLTFVLDAAFVKVGSQQTFAACCPNVRYM